MRAIGGWLERWQVALYVVAIAAGAAIGLLAPAVAPTLTHAITPVLALLLYATFLGVPFHRLGAAVRDRRFVATVLVVNFVLVPVAVFALSRFVAHDRALLVGVLLVLLTPCVDYVIVFAGLAGGARDRLLAVTPLLMLVQVLLLPVWLWGMAGTDVLAAFDAWPFVEAFLLLIALPLALAAGTQALARRSRAVARFAGGMLGAMVPLMMLTLGVVVASQIAAVGGALGRLVAAVPVFAGFVVGAALIGALAGRVARLDVAGRRAVVFSGVTRNSLVVLPLALALPPAFALTPLVVVTQTLVELVAMVVLVAVVPRTVGGPRAAASRSL